MEIVLATRNKDKIREIKEILEGLKVKILTFEDFPFVPEVEEDGSTLEENAIKKAKTWSEHTGKIALADDSGLEVDYLDGQPGVYSSRFAGEKATYADNNRKLLQLLARVPEEKRGACFRCVVAISFPKGKVELLEGKIKGIITSELRGKAGFGYDPVFLILEYGKTFAELGLKIKNQISHRAQSFQKAKQYLSELIHEETKNCS